MVDLPTEGRPTRPTVALPDFLTAKESPAPPPWLACFSCWARRAAILALSFPMWNSVALFFWVLKISASISLIWSAIVPTARCPRGRPQGPAYKGCHRSAPPGRPFEGCPSVLIALGRRLPLDDARLRHPPGPPAPPGLRGHGRAGGPGGW